MSPSNVKSFAVVLAVAALGAAPPRSDEADRGKAPPLVRTAKSGAWSAAATWEGGKVPGEGARVQIKSGHHVTYDLESKAVVRSIHVAGELSFARDRDTVLNVGLIKIQAGDDASEEGFDCEAHPDRSDGPKP